MALTQHIEVRQSQHLVMTPQLQQAIKLLQMSNLELEGFILGEIESNPLLEKADDEGENLPAEMVPTPPEILPVPSDDPVPMTSESLDEAMPDPDAVWAADGYDATSDTHSERGSQGVFEDDDLAGKLAIANAPSLRDHLLEQVHVDIHDPVDRLIAVTLIDMLDEAGYLPSDLGLARTQLGAEPERFESVLDRLQHFDPPGIFARSLKECLALQLREQNRLDPAMQILLDNLELLARREHATLMKRCRVDQEDLAEMIAEIKRLNPKPGLEFNSDIAQTVVPDVFLRPLPGGGWHVELNSETLPRVLANERYYTRIQATASKTDKAYLSERWQQANWLVKALNQRATTILKVATEIVRQQDEFFVHGVQKLKPLVLRDIATAVEMHESTVSRVTQNKYMATPRGLFELKYFFTTGLGRSDGDNDVSSEAVRARIRSLIENERQDTILADDTIAAVLRGDGVNIARRTVAKYREAMGIPTSALRRRQKRA